MGLAQVRLTSQSTPTHQHLACCFHFLSNLGRISAIDRFLKSVANMMPRQRNHRSSARKSSYSTLVFAVLIMFTFVILFLLAFGILSVPNNNAGSSEANDLTSIVRKTLQRYQFNGDFTVLRDRSILLYLELFFFRRSGEDDDSQNERWVEVISWEPRASIYHNFLVSL